jgi:MFS transporter, YNFM family, putative membrane transport protein
MTTEAASPRIARGSRAFWRANVALFASGFSVFALLYSVQPLLPVFAEEFALDAGTSSLALSVSTGVMAVAMLVASFVADRWGRKPLMTASLLIAAALGLAIALVPGWSGIVALRALLGLALSGVPAVAMAYLAEELEADGFGFSMGLYIGGNAIGGMSGRLLVGVLADYSSWRLALGTLAVLVLANAALFWWLLPQPWHSPGRSTGRPAPFAALRRQFADLGLALLFLEAFLIMGAFVTVYNYASFRLLGPPYDLSQAAVSLIFILYLCGTGSSAWIGALAGRLGRRKVLWLMVVVMAAGLALTCLDPLVAIVLGIAVFTFGFFGAHSIASAWVGRRARDGRAQATALYLFFYYVGSSVVGTAGGYAWTWGAWTGVALVSGSAIAAALAVALRLVFVAPLPIAETPIEPPASL